MEYNLLGVTLTINLEPGLYIFESISGSGKTYLGELIKMFKQVDKSAGSKLEYITYNESGDYSVVKTLVGSKDKVIIFDRYTLYQSEELAKYIMELARNNVVILDLKVASKYRIGKVRFCYIKQTVNSCEVYRL